MSAAREKLAQSTVVNCMDVTDMLRDAQVGQSPKAPLIGLHGYWEDQLTFIEAVSGIKLPASLGTANRCSLDFRLRTNDSDQWTCNISLRLEYDSAGKRLHEPNEFPIGKSFSDPHRVASAVYRAQRLLLIMSKGNCDISDLKSLDDVADDGVSHTLNYVCLKVSGSPVDLSFVALPSISSCQPLEMYEAMLDQSLSLLERGSFLKVMVLLYGNSGRNNALLGHFKVRSHNEVAVFIKRDEIDNLQDHTSFCHQSFPGKTCIVFNTEPGRKRKVRADEVHPTVPEHQTHPPIIDDICSQFYGMVGLASLEIFRGLSDYIGQLRLQEEELGQRPPSLKREMLTTINRYSDAFNLALSKVGAAKVDRHLKTLGGLLNNIQPKLAAATITLGNCHHVLQDDSYTADWHVTVDKLKLQSERDVGRAPSPAVLSTASFWLVRQCFLDWGIETTCFVQHIKHAVEEVIEEASKSLPYMAHNFQWKIE